MTVVILVSAEAKFALDVVKATKVNADQEEIEVLQSIIDKKDVIEQEQCLELSSERSVDLKLSVNGYKLVTDVHLLTLSAQAGPQNLSHSASILVCSHLKRF